MRSLFGLILLVTAGAACGNPLPPPVIDMHLHAFRVGSTPEHLVGYRLARGQRAPSAYGMIQSPLRLSRRVESVELAAWAESCGRKACPLVHALSSDLSSF
jgi:hypothetical protein